MEKLETEERFENKIIKRFMKHETELVKSSNDESFKLRNKLEAFHFKYIELNQKLLFYVSIRVASSVPLTKLISMLSNEINLQEPTLLVLENNHEGYLLYELESAIFNEIDSKAYKYYQSVLKDIKSKFVAEEVKDAVVISNPLNHNFDVYVSDKRYELKELKD